MVIPILFIRWLSIAVLIAIGLLLIIFVLFGAAMHSLIVPTAGQKGWEGIKSLPRTKR